MIDLYTWTTPNGWKASCALEEMELDYKVIPIDIGTNVQKEKPFIDINPNGRIPAIVDKGNDDLAVFESGAIMVYLAEKTGKFLPADSIKRAKVFQWLMFQMGGLGPMQGQANVFHRYFPEKIPAAIDRYQGETKRLLKVLDTHLADNEYLAGDFSIADIANWSWARIHGWAGVSIEEFVHLERWLALIEARPGCARGLMIPDSTDFHLANNDDDLV